MPAEVTFPPEPVSVRAARRYVADRLTALGFEDASFVAGLLVSELVTNAVLHARTAVTVGVDQHDDEVRISVTDRSARPVRIRRHSVESGTGRGLMLVERLAARWGVDQMGMGKVVWFDLPHEPAVDVTDVADTDALLDAWEA